MLVKLRVESMNSLNKIITEHIRQVEGVDKTKTLMVMKEV